MIRTVRALTFAAALVAVPSFAQAQATLGPMVAYHEHADFGIGATFGVPFGGTHENLGFLGDFLIFFPDITGLDYIEINGNLTYDIPLEGASVLPFALGGLNIARASGGGESNTEIGLNVGGGLKFIAGTLQPLVGVRLEIEGGDGFVIFGALPFALGG